MLNKPSFDLTGKVAVVTGGTGTLGFALCEGLAQAGAKVAILARDKTKLEQAAKTLEESGATAIGISADAMDKTALQNAADQILDRFGQVDILVNGAGGNHRDGSTAPKERTFFDLPADGLRWVFDLNFTSAVLASQVFGAVMVKQNEGVILNISSMAAYQPMTRNIAYGGAKAAINNFTYWLAVYMATEHSEYIRVNAIAPGFFLSDQNRFLLIDEKTGDLTERGDLIIKNTPMKRFGQAEELIGAMLWLVSDASKFVTGVVVPVDGGFMAYSGV